MGRSERGTLRGWYVHEELRHDGWSVVLGVRVRCLIEEENRLYVFGDAGVSIMLDIGVSSGLTSGVRRTYAAGFKLYGCTPKEPSRSGARRK